MATRSTNAANNSRSHARYILRTPVFELRFEMLITLLAMGLLIFVQTVEAETKKTVVKKTTTITTTTTKSEDEEDEAGGPDGSSSRIQAPLEKDFVVTATFGSKAQTGMTGCKTADLKKETVRDLKNDCRAWLKDQKTDLKSKYQNGVCNEDCSDCGMNLQRCHVIGTVHYSK